jgi:NAD-dependent dihydropyrimidine dehydrogenase PreA subunit
VSINISKEKCIRCGICIDECPTGAICYGENNITQLIDKDCNDCGLCIPVCVAEAISQ